MIAKPRPNIEALKDVLLNHPDRAVEICNTLIEYIEVLEYNAHEVMIISQMARNVEQRRAEEFMEWLNENDAIGTRIDTLGWEQHGTTLGTPERGRFKSE